MTRPDWVMSGGGPLLVIEEALALSWGGVFKLSVREEGMANDYERAWVGKNDYVTTVAVAGGTALSLTELGPASSTFWCSSEGPLYIAQVEYAEADTDFAAILAKLDTEVFHVPDATTPFRCMTHTLVMFDSACPWDDPGKVARATLKAGGYSVQTKSYTLNPDEYLFVLHRFFPI